MPQTRTLAEKRERTIRRVERLEQRDAIKREQSQNTQEEEILLAACRLDEPTALELLLIDQSMVQVVLAVREREHFMGLFRPFQNIDLMIREAAKSGQLVTTNVLIDFATKHGIPHHSIIGPTTIHEAIDGHNLTILTTLLDKVPELVNYRGGHGITMLQDVIASGSNRGRSKASFPPYHNLHMAAIAVLLEKGADPNFDSEDPGNVIGNVCQCGPLELLSLLLHYGVPISQSLALHNAAKTGRIDMLEYLVQHGADLNEQVTPAPYYKYPLETPLHSAIRAHQLGSIKWLLEKDVDTSIRDFEGHTPYDIAVLQDNPEILKILVVVKSLM